MRLKIAAKVDAADGTYFRDSIKPLLDDPLIEFVGEISDAEKSAFLGNASALLFPIDWPEPFGLVMPPLSLGFPFAPVSVSTFCIIKRAPTRNNTALSTVTFYGHARRHLFAVKELSWIPPRFS